MTSHNRVYRLKTPCPRCNKQVLYNQSHSLRYCSCTAPEKVTIVQSELDRDWTLIKEHITVEVNKPRQEPAGNSNTSRTGTSGPMSLVEVL